MLLDRANKCVPHNSPYCSLTWINNKPNRLPVAQRLDLFTWSVRMRKPQRAITTKDMIFPQFSGDFLSSSSSLLFIIHEFHRDASLETKLQGRYVAFSRHPPASSSPWASLPSSFMIWVFLYIRPFTTIWGFSPPLSPPPPPGRRFVGGLCRLWVQKYHVVRNKTVLAEVQRTDSQPDIIMSLASSSIDHRTIQAVALRILLPHSEP